MQTTLIYRFPNDIITEKQGVFRKLNKPESFEGFIISDFEGNNFYGFYENESGEQSVAKEIPIVISKSAYCDLAHEFIHYLQDFNIGKAILSRVKDIDFEEHNRLKLFYKLAEKYPTAFCYSFDSPFLGKWIGATPETLIKIEEGRGQTMSLAGTKPVDNNAGWGKKEIHEQQLVTDFIYEELLALCENVIVSDRKELIAGPVKHLAHHFNFNVKQKNQWSLIQRLHPTPAISGFPRDKALKCIDDFEPHKRDFYAGMIGWKTNSQTNIFVNLRSAQIMKNKLYMYVGGGLTQQSVPEDEWEETENKAKTIVELL